MDNTQLQNEITAFLQELDEENTIDDVGSLVDIYLISNEVKDDVDTYRKDISSQITEAVPAGNVSGDLGEVTIIHRTQHSLKNEALVLKRLQDAGLGDPTEVMSLDKAKVKQVCRELDIDESEVLDETSYSYVRKNTFRSPWD